VAQQRLQGRAIQGIDAGMGEQRPAQHQRGAPRAQRRPAAAQGGGERRGGEHHGRRGEAQQTRDQTRGQQMARMGPDAGHSRAR
jgi:hypothetical protein